MSDVEDQGAIHTVDVVWFLKPLMALLMSPTRSRDLRA